MIYLDYRLCLDMASPIFVYLRPSIQSASAADKAHKVVFLG